MVDDHALFRAGLQLILKELASKHKPEFVEANSAAEAIKLSGEVFDLILLDLIMPGSNGRQAFDAVVDAFTGTRIVIVSGEDSPQLVRETIEAGASGYILKQTQSAVFGSALELVLAGGVYLPPSILRYFDAAGEIHDSELKTQQNTEISQPDAKQTGELTNRQLDVLKAVVRGGSNKSIAKELNVSEGTVKAHLSSAYRVLGVRTRTQAVMAVASSGYPETKE
ncbi:MAG: response regulator [Burkholderiaceae bacterium]